MWKLNRVLDDSFAWRRFGRLESAAVGQYRRALLDARSLAPHRGAAIVDAGGT
jgi:hypothetical protein